VFDAYDYVCKIHGKKSPARGAETYYGRAWRGRCLADLLGAPGHIARIIAMFEEDSRLGIVGPAHVRQPSDRISPAAALGLNRALVTEFLSKRFGDDVASRARIDFFAGSMFWFRPRALEPTRALQLSAADFPDEAQQPDATMAHALERLIPMIAVISGFRIEGVVLPDPRSEHHIAGSGFTTETERLVVSPA
jgi:lipopolysaccharide biosynthesis protein